MAIVPPDCSINEIERSASLKLALLGLVFSIKTLLFLIAFITFE